MRRWLAVIWGAVAGCHGYDLVQPESEPTSVSISVSAQHDTRTVTWTSIVIEPGIDETGDFRRVPLEPGIVDGRTLQPQQAPNGRLVFYGMVDTTALLVAPRMVTVVLPALVAPGLAATVQVPIIVAADSTRTTLRGAEDLRLRIAYPADMVQSDYRFASWNLSLRTISCEAGARVLDLAGSGMAPAELRVARSLIATGGATSFAACLRVFFARSERMETVALSVSSNATVSWSVTVQP